MRGHICATDSPHLCNYGLRRCAMDNKGPFESRVAETVRQNINVADLLKSFITEEEAIELCHHLENMLRQAGLRLTTLLLNSKKVLAALSPERAANCKNPNLVHLSTKRALGVRWDIRSDTPGITVVTSLDDATTRSLPAATSIYDPFGLGGSATLVAKRVLQMSCKLRRTLDDLFTGELLDAWEQWKAQIKSNVIS